MSGDKEIRVQLLNLLRGGSAHMDFNEVIANFPLKYINKKPPNVPYTFWHLLEHMRIAQRDILEFIRNPEHVSPDWPDEYWPQKDQRAGKVRWDKTIKGFRADLKSILNLVKNPETDFFAPIPHARNYNIFREILLVADHNSFHIGEFIILRQVVKTLPPDRW